MSEILKPCPFCGKVPVFDKVSEIYGTCFDYNCDCGLAVVNLQICDLMTIEERLSDDFIDYKYGDEYCERARNEAIKLWNYRDGKDE